MIYINLSLDTHLRFFVQNGALYWYFKLPANSYNHCSRQLPVNWAYMMLWLADGPSAIQVGAVLTSWESNASRFIANLDKHRKSNSPRFITNLCVGRFSPMTLATAYGMVWKYLDISSLTYGRFLSIWTLHPFTLLTLCLPCLHQR